jgi:predicted O-linked N-acetylglucosamine transferase (SPINDLY family)
MTQGPHRNSPIAQAVALHQAGRLDEAARLYLGILQRAPRDFNALHFLGVLRLAQGKPGEAVRLIRQALTVDARFADAHLNLGNALASQGQIEAAAASFCAAIAREPGLAQAHFNLGNALKSLGRLDDAVAAYAQSVTLAPAVVEAQYNLGNALKALARFDEAIACYDRALQLKPDHAEAWLNRGDALRLAQRIEAAAESFAQALRCDPSSSAALNNLGNVLAELKRFDPAIATFRQALSLAPNAAATLVNFAACLRNAGRHDEAAASCRAALAVEPANADAQYNLGLALLELGRREEALACFRTTLAQAPDHQDALSIALSTADAACDWSALRDLERRFAERLARGDLAIDPFYCLNRDCDAAAQLLCARNYLARRGIRRRDAGFGSAPPGPKLRIAYVSADFRAHPMSLLIGEMIRRHDRAEFEILGISHGADDHSEARRVIAASFDHFIDVGAESDEAIARRLHALGIDIAIDLGGHTRNSRIGIFAWRPAPVQVAYLGFAGSCGADFIDYILADRFVLPLDQQPVYSERIVHLPDCYFVNHARRPLGGAVPSRAECGLPEAGFVFCSFNNTYKIKPEIFAIWLRLLHAVPGSVLWLLGDNAAAERNLRAAAASGGIDPLRLVFAPRRPQAEHLARHGQADLFLDTLPANAHTTCADALWAGLPVVTCPGRTLIGRTAGSMLTTLGLPELIAPDLAGYEALALALARDPGLLAGMRRRIEAGRGASPLFDAARYARGFEAAYRTMAARYRRGEKPEGFAV